MGKRFILQTLGGIKMRFRELTRTSRLNEAVRFNKVSGGRGSYTFRKEFSKDIAVEVQYYPENHHTYLTIPMAGNYAIQDLMCQRDVAKAIIDFCSELCPNGDPNEVDTRILDDVLKSAVKRR